MSCLPLYFAFSHVPSDKSMWLSILLTIRKCQNPVQPYYRDLIDFPHNFKIVSYLNKKTQADFLVLKLSSGHFCASITALRCSHSLWCKMAWTFIEGSFQYLIKYFSCYIALIPVAFGWVPHSPRPNSSGSKNLNLIKIMQQQQKLIFYFLCWFFPCTQQL